MDTQRIYSMSFASVYPLYVAKVERKGRTRADLDTVIDWLTGYRGASLQKALDEQIDFQTFFANAPALNPKRSLITGVICGVRVEEITDSTVQLVRYLDKLVDEVAKGKAMEKILRS